MKFKSNKGFTLLELLVVIAIIAILVGLGTVSYSVVQRKARNARRRSDLKAAQNAFEQYYALSNFYPTSCMSGTTISFSVGGNPFSATDPKDISPNQYSCTCTTGTTYSCSVLLEGGGAFTISALQ